MTNSGRQLLDEVYSRLGFDGGDLLTAVDRPNATVVKDWVEKGDWLTLAKKVGAEKVFFVDNVTVHP